MVSFENLPEIFYLGVYQPSSGECDDFDFTWYSSKILDLKNCEPSVVEAFADCISSNLGNDFDCLAVVPSHYSGVDTSGIKFLTEEISRRMKLVDATSCLIRYKTTEKLSTGGDRSIETHLNSIKVVHKELIEGKKVLLLDDVSTTGNSLKACKQLLELAGVKAVKSFVLGKTVRWLEDLDFFCCQYESIQNFINEEEWHLGADLYQVTELNHYAVEHEYESKIESLLENYEEGYLSDEDFLYYKGELEGSSYESHKEIDYQNTKDSYFINYDAICQKEALDNLYIFSFSSLPGNYH